MSAEGMLLAAATSLALGGFIWLAGRGRHQGEFFWVFGLLAALVPLIVAAAAPFLTLSMPAIAEPLEPVAALFAARDTPAPFTGAVQTQSGLPWALVLLGLWGLGATVRGAVELRRSARLAARIAGTSAASRELREDVARAAGELAISRTINVRTDTVRSPFVCGLARPVLVLPEAASVDPMVMAHELAHIRRHDSWRRIAVRTAGLALWFNPFVFLIERERRLAVEISCDRIALESAGNGRARTYARTLLQAACANSGPQAALGFGVDPKKALEMRITSILSPAPKARSASAAIAVAAVLALGLPLAGLQVAEAAGLAADPEFTATVVEGRTTSRFGPAAPGPNGPRQHGGHDIAAPAGTPVSAAAGGRVTYAGSAYNGQEAWGNVVEIDHGGGWTTIYAQLQDYSVSRGEAVRAGQVIARVGSSGVSTGPHLHVEVRRDGERVDPALYLPGLSPATPSDG